MCGRYVLRLVWRDVRDLYRLTLPDEPPEPLKPSYNVAPTDVMPIIRPQGNGRELMMAGWGLMPYWLKPEQLNQRPYSTINARSDRIRTAPTYREPFAKRRCIVPATGWYEWQKVSAKQKRPFHFQPKATPFAFAGVYDVWNADGGKPIRSFAIVTTDAATSTAPYHDRMPMVLEESQFEDWMRGTPDQAAAMMKPYAGELDIWEVGAEVGNVKNNRPELVERVGLL
jgi:putative SOS response-associated peptidase YedK